MPMFYSPFMTPGLAGYPQNPAAMMSRAPMPNAAPQIGAPQIQHPMMAYSPMMMGRQMQPQPGQGSPLAGVNPQQLSGLLALLKGGGMQGGGAQFMGTLPGGVANYGPGLLAAASQGVDPQMAMGGP